MIFLSKGPTLTPTTLFSFNNGQLDSETISRGPDMYLFFISKGGAIEETKFVNRLLKRSPWFGGKNEKLYLFRRPLAPDFNVDAASRAANAKHMLLHQSPT